MNYRIAGNFRGGKVKVCEIIFAVFIFVILNEPTFELGDRIKRWLLQTTVIRARSQFDELDTFEYPVNGY